MQRAILCLSKIVRQKPVSCLFVVVVVVVVLFIYFFCYFVLSYFQMLVALFLLLFYLFLLYDSSQALKKTHQREHNLFLLCFINNRAVLFFDFFTGASFRPRLLPRSFDASPGTY